MITEIEDAVIVWNYDDKYNGARIMRVYTAMPSYTIPEYLDKIKVTSVGPYCFSDVNNVKRYMEISDDLKKRIETVTADKGFCEFCGNYIESIGIADSVVEISNNAFYNCRNMKKLLIGSMLTEFGSDIFMNCRKFHELDINCNINEKTGLKQLLSRYGNDLKVKFIVNGTVSAEIFYPEYTESYDEIAPAHIFGRNITGEGFRARQCFNNDVPDMAKYDKIFAKASVEESISTVCEMAMSRLMYPVALGDSAREAYLDYIKTHDKEIVSIITARKDIWRLKFLCQENRVSVAAVDAGIACASEMEWGEGVASLLKWKHEFFDNIKKKRYEF
ncbi:MAG: leucine-rich repeat protein [Lachnospiraceae bacterium]|nr:leucine-rich repeat protein [Lachnospiraceae bacterium]